MKKIVCCFAVFASLWACKQPREIKSVAVLEETVIAPSGATFASNWEVLFDGTSFEHWRGYLKDEMPSEWSIEDGAMVYTPGESHGNDIITKKTYTSFVLSLEWKISEGGNSGIFWGVHEDKKFPYPFQTGPEIQVLDDEKHPDSFVGEGTHKAGSLYDMLAPKENVVHPAGEWNLCEIEINQTTNRGKVTLNGTVIVNFQVHGRAWNAMVSDSKFKDWEGFGAYPTGHIGLQDHGDPVWFRNIKIKELEGE